MDASWFPAGVPLANNYHLRYVIVSSDSEGGSWERGYGMHD